VPPGEYDGYVTSKQKLCTLDAKSTYCNCMTEMHTAGIWDPILDNYLVMIVLSVAGCYLHQVNRLQIEKTTAELHHK